MSESDRTQPNPSVPPPGGESLPPAPLPLRPAQGDTQPRLPRADIHVGGNVGGDVAAGDLNKTVRAGRDVVGRDVINEQNTTHIGFTPEAVQRLLLTVGLLVFVTAACFFSGGALLGGVAIATLNREVNSSPQAANRFEALLAELRALPAGQRITFTLSEDEISSYFRLVVAPELPGDISDGKVRLLDSDQMVVGGRAGALGNLAFAARFTWQDVPGAPLQLTGAAVQVLPLENTAFGWVYVPAVALSFVEHSINDLFAGVRITNVVPQTEKNAWTVTAVGQ